MAGRARLLRATERGRARVAAATEVLSAIHTEWERRLVGITPDQLLDGLAALIAACEAIRAAAPRPRRG